MKKVMIGATFVGTVLVGCASTGRGEGVEPCNPSNMTDVSVSFEEAKILANSGLDFIQDAEGSARGDYVDKIGEVACYSSEGTLVLTKSGLAVQAVSQP